MKKYFILLLMALCTLCMQAQYSRNQYYLFVSSHTDLLGQWKVEVVDSIYFEEEAEHDYVDLGLPSGLLWATCNIGAATPEDYGDYFAWGETTSKSDYSWSTYKYGNSTTSITKYCTHSEEGTVDNKTTLEPEDDVAHVIWGDGWRMPTDAEYGELINYCTWQWTTQNGIQGYLLTSTTNGKTLFLPCAGYRTGTSLNGTEELGYYWSSSIHENSSIIARFLHFNLRFFYHSYNYRYEGRSVRPVWAPLQK